jgi:restriction endonuclease S subunit
MRKHAKYTYQSQFLEMFGEEAKWKIMPLKDIVHVDCPISYGIVQPGDDLEDGISIVRPVDMTSDLYIGKDGLKKTSKAISESYRRTILRGDEILLCVRGTTGLVNLAKSELAGCNVTRGITPLYFKDNINPRYVYCVLTSPKAQQYIADHTHGSTLKGINMEDVRNLPIPIPSLEVQNQCESILIQADKSKFDGFKSQFLEMFGNPQTCSSGVVGKDVFEFASGKALTKENLNPEYEYNCYGGNGVTGKSNDYLVEASTIVIGRVGEYCGGIHLTNPYSWITDNAIYLKKYDSRYELEFIEYLFKAMDFHRFASESGQPKITQSPLIESVYPLPSKDEQIAFLIIKRQADKSKYYELN